MSFSMALGAWFSVEDLDPMLAQRVARFLVDTIAQNDGHSQINVNRYKAPRTNDQRPSKWRGFSTTLPTRDVPRPKIPRTGKTKNVYLR